MAIDEPTADARGTGSASIDPRTPVIIGVGQFLNRAEDGNGPLEPADLMTEAVRLAADDAGIPAALGEVQVIAAVPTFSWRYRDPASIVRGQIGADDAATWSATVGGNTPQLLMNRLARTISRGETDFAVLCGAEAVRSRRAAKRAGQELDWTRQDDAVVPDWFDETPFMMSDPAELERGIVMPLQAYPLFENALWHDSGRPLGAHLARIGEMWAGFSRIAATNPHAWRREAFTAEEIVTPTAQNRMIGFPYTKRMVSNVDVDMSSAAIVCSAERARRLGVPSDRWVFVHSGTDGVDLPMSRRRDFVSSPAIGVAGRRALELADTGIDGVDHLDLYSCFPSAVQLALKELDIPIERQLTVYGGLSFAGGPWNNPVGHAIASMVEVLRERSGLGLVTANGGHVDKHAFGVYGSRPPADGFRYDRPQEAIDTFAGRDVVIDHHGPATIETWTVMFDRDGSPERAHAACLTEEGVRTWGISTDTAVMASMVGVDMVGVAVQLGADGELQLR